MQMSMEEINNLRSLLAKATPGPWVFLELTTKPDGLGYIQREDHDGKEIAHHGDMGRSRNENCTNAALIVAAVNALPDLLDLASQTITPRTQAGAGVEELCERLDGGSLTAPAGTWMRYDAEATDKLMREAAAMIRHLSSRVEEERRAKEEAERWVDRSTSDRERDLQIMLDAEYARAEAAESRSAALARALEDIAREAASPAASYEKNGPTWTGKDGHEYEDMSAHLEFAERIETLARSALQPTRTILEAPNAG